MNHDNLNPSGVLLFTGILSSYLYLQQTHFLPPLSSSSNPFLLTRNILQEHSSKKTITNTSSTNLSSLSPYKATSIHHQTTTSTPTNHNHNNNSNSLPRVESEYSLGLNRSESVNEHLMEFGEFCSTGQMAISVFKYSVLPITASVAVIWFYLKKEQN